MIFLVQISYAFRSIFLFLASLEEIFIECGDWIVHSFRPVDIERFDDLVLDVFAILRLTNVALQLKAAKMFRPRTS